MQGPNQFGQFPNPGLMNQFPPNPGMFPNFATVNPQFQQLNNQAFPNPQMPFQTIQPQMPQMVGMNPSPIVQPGAGSNLPATPPPKQRLIVKLENNERGFYSTMLSQVDPNDSGKIDGKQSVPFFKRSGLPVDVLKKIWLIASSNNQYLDKEEFYVALRLIAYAQNNIEVSPQSILLNIKAPLPKFQAALPPKKAEPSTEAPPASTDIKVGDPLISNPQIGLLDSIPGPTTLPGNMPGNMSVNLLGNMPMGMPSSFPGNIPQIPSDNLLGVMPGPMMPGLGPGNIQGIMPGNVPSVMPDLLSGAQDSGAMPNLMDSQPATIPADNSINPVQQAQQTDLNRASSIGSLDNNSGGNAALPSEQIPDLTPEYTAQYEMVFDKFDVNKKGVITQMEAKDIFSRSGLPNEILYQIWLFCDTGDRGCLDKPEFMLALHLIAASKRNVKLPLKLPLKFEKFLKDAKRKLPTKDYLLEKIREAEQHNQALMEDHSQQPQPAMEYNQQSHVEAPQVYDDNNYYPHNNVHTLEVPQTSDFSGLGGQVKDDIPLVINETTVHVTTGLDSNFTQKIQQHQIDLVSVVTQIAQLNSRVLQDKAEDVNKLSNILQNCQAILNKLRTENDYIQNNLLKSQTANPIHAVHAGTNIAATNNSLFGGSPLKPATKVSTVSPLKVGEDGFGKIEINMEGHFNNNFDQMGEDFQKDFANEF